LPLWSPGSDRTKSSSQGIAASETSGAVMALTVAAIARRAVDAARPRRQLGGAPGSVAVDTASASAAATSMAGAYRCRRLLAARTEARSLARPLLDAAATHDPFPKEPP
jgi:hypothetical protein